MKPNLSNPLGRPRGTQNGRLRANSTARKCGKSINGERTKPKNNRATTKKSKQQTRNSLRSSPHDMEELSDASKEVQEEVSHMQDNDWIHHSSSCNNTNTAISASICDDGNEYASLGSNELFKFGSLSSAGRDISFGPSLHPPTISKHEYHQLWSTLNPKTTNNTLLDVAMEAQITPGWDNIGLDFDRHSSDMLWTPPTTPHKLVNHDFNGTNCSHLPGSHSRISPRASISAGYSNRNPQTLNNTPPPPAPPISTAESVMPQHQLMETLPKACCCLQQHVELVNDIQSLDSFWEGNDNANLSLDQALALVKQGIYAWQNLVACPQCSFGRNQSVVRLALMTIRAIIRHFQRLASQYQDGGNLHAQQSTRAISSSENDAAFVVVGCVQVEGEERTLIFQLLIQRALSKIKTTLRSIQSIQEKQKECLVQQTAGRAAEADDYQASNSLLQTQQMISTLIRTVEALEVCSSGI